MREVVRMSSAPRTAVVTGVARKRGIGRACVRALSKAGYRVVGIDIKDITEGAEELANLATFSYLKADLANDGQLEAAARSAIECLGGHVNVLVNNAGIAQPYMPGSTAERKELWFRYIGTNLSAAFLMSEALLPHMPAGDASIVHISSTRAKQSEPHSEGYAAAKAGLLGLTHSQAVSLGPRVRVNAILPGYIHTEDEDPATALAAEDHNWHLTGRVGTPEDVAELCAFLADNEKAGFITGQHFTIDGGVSVKMVYPE